MDKKQLIIPVLTLLLCASVVVGVGYGITLNSTVTSSDNTVAGESITVDLTDNGSELTTVAFDNGKITYTTDIVYTTPNTKTTTYNIAENQTITLNDANIKLKASQGASPLASTVTVTITGDALAQLQSYFKSMTVKIGELGEVTDSNLADGISFPVPGFDGNEAAVKLTGVTKAWSDTTAPVFSNTFDVKFSVTATIE